MSRPAAPKANTEALLREGSTVSRPAVPKANTEALLREGSPVSRPAAPKANTEALLREGSPLSQEGSRPQVKVEQHGAACRITIDRAEAHNTMTDVVMRDLIEALRAAEAMEGVRAVVLTGAGDKTFCAGGQLKPTADGSPFALEPGRFDNPVADLFRAMDRCNLPLIARVNGGAFGGGLGLICACDFALGVEGAMFGTTEARVGVFPMMILPLLMRVIPRRRLMEMCFFAQRFSAAEAQSMDILNRVVAADALDAAVDEMLARIVANSPVALRIGRRAFNAMQDQPLADALNLAQALIPVLSQSEDAREGMKAFAERRPPVWPGR